MVLGALLIAAGSANQGGNRSSAQPQQGPPPPQPMDSQAALGLWKSSFGPVKIEPDQARGAGQLMGVWVYDRAGQEVVGYFSGPISGNVMTFTWTEPATPKDLTGSGYLVFDVAGRSFAGKWWTTARDRGGDWNGWRGEAGAAPPGEPGQPGPAEPPPEGEGVDMDAPPPPSR